MRPIATLEVHNHAPGNKQGVLLRPPARHAFLSPWSNNMTEQGLCIWPELVRPPGDVGRRS